MIFIVFDLEATCWRGKPPKGANEIIEIGAFKINQYGETLSSFNSFVKPILSPILSGFCKDLTSIKQENIDRARDFKRVFRDFESWSFEQNDDVLLCSWGRMDQYLLQNDCILHKLEDDWLDNYIDIKYQYHNNRKILKHKGLMRTLNNEGIEFTGIEHRALSDAENLAKIFTKYIDEWIY